VARIYTAVQARPAYFIASDSDPGDAADPGGAPEQRRADDDPAVLADSRR
jgi:dolichol-phosphate mannosyltransferase